MGALLQLLLLGASFKRVRAPHQPDDAERALDEPRTRASVVDLLATRPPPEAQIAKLEHSAAPRPGLAGFARVLAEAAYGSLEEQRRLRRAVSLEVASKFADPRVPVRV